MFLFDLRVAHGSVDSVTRLLQLLSAYRARQEFLHTESHHLDQNNRVIRIAHSEYGYVEKLTMKLTQDSKPIRTFFWDINQKELRLNIANLFDHLISKAVLGE